MTYNKEPGQFIMQASFKSYSLSKNIATPRSVPCTMHTLENKGIF